MFLLYLILPWIKIFKDGHKTEFFVCLALLIVCPILGLLIPGFSFFGSLGFAWNIAVLWMIYLARNDQDEDSSLAYEITGGKVGKPKPQETKQDSN